MTECNFVDAGVVGAEATADYCYAHQNFCLDDPPKPRLKALTLHQPWASLIAVGEKTIETRSWSTKHRGDLVIHAGRASEALGYLCWMEEHQGEPEDVLEALRQHGFTITPERSRNGRRVIAKHDLPMGAGIAVVALVDVLPMIERDTDECVAWRNAGSVEPRCVIRSGGMAKEAWLVREGVSRYVRDQVPFGDFRAGRFAWELDNIRTFDAPLARKGRQQLWNLPENFELPGLTPVAQ